MVEQELILDLKLEGLADYVSRFMNKYKSELLIKGYVIKNEWDIKEDVGGKIIGKRKIDLGGIVEVEKKIGKKYKLKIEFRAVDEDLRIIAWPSKSKLEVTPVIIEELEKFAKKVEEKIEKS